MARKRTFHTFREAQKLGAFAEMPMLPEEIQVQLRLSRNLGSQPFHALFARDTLLLLLSGSGTLELRGSSVREFRLDPGDCVYVPAGTAHRLCHPDESVMLRYVPQAPGVEGAAWYCKECGIEVHRETWRTTDGSAHEGYLASCARFNADAARRTCGRCGAAHPPVEVDGFRWAELAAQCRGP